MGGGGGKWTESKEKEYQLEQNSATIATMDGQISGQCKC